VWAYGAVPWWIALITAGILLAWTAWATIPAFSLAVHWKVPRKAVGGGGGGGTVLAAEVHARSRQPSGELLPAGGEHAQAAAEAAGKLEGSGSRERAALESVALAAQLQAEAADLRARLARVEASLAAAQ
jgi:hypothetical protein